LLSLGDHLYIDRGNPQWKSAILEMVKIMNEVKLQCGANSILLRDFDTPDTELSDFLAKEGFFRSDMFNDHVIENLNWSTNEEFLQTLSAKSRVHLRKYILPNQPLFSVRINAQIDPKTFDDKINLYRQVKDRGFDMNTFYLPDKFFHNINKFDNWEIIELTLNDSNSPETMGFGICYKSSAGNYIPLIVGLNYNANQQYGTYRQILFQAVKRAAYLQCKKLYFGFGADIEKHKFGTRLIKKSAYIQSDDNYSMESLSTFQQVNDAK